MDFMPPIFGTFREFRVIRTKKFQVASWTIIVLLCALEIWGLMRIPSVNHALVLATTHQPEPITELYISDPNTIPGTFSQNVPDSFSFSIHNLEGSDLTYHYQLSINGAPYGPVQTVKIPNGNVGTVNSSFLVTDSSTRAEVAVTLLDQNQSIHFWTERTN